jgi:hypothetical protein
MLDAIHHIYSSLLERVEGFLHPVRTDADVNLLF